MGLTLFIGNKKYSSWSMRPWLALRAANIAFDEVLIPLYTGDADKQRILGVTKSGKVPALKDGDLTIWDSLAIIEYVAERYPEAKLWPADQRHRAHARSVSAEMHSSFLPLRRECGMNLRRTVRPKQLSPDAQADIARIQEVWSDCRSRYHGGGPFLFGAFTAADAMYAPVVHRFRTYAIPVSAPVQAYMNTMQALPAFEQWTEQGIAETLIIARFEDD